MALLSARKEIINSLASENYEDNDKEQLEEQLRENDKAFAKMSEETKNAISEYFETTEDSNLAGAEGWHSLYNAFLAAGNSAARYAAAEYYDKQQQLADAKDNYEAEKAELYGQYKELSDQFREAKAKKEAAIKEREEKLLKQEKSKKAREDKSKIENERLIRNEAIEKLKTELEALQNKKTANNEAFKKLEKVKTQVDNFNATYSEKSNRIDNEKFSCRTVAGILNAYADKIENHMALVKELEETKDSLSPEEIEKKQHKINMADNDVLNFYFENTKSSENFRNVISQATDNEREWVVNTRNEMNEKLRELEEEETRLKANKKKAVEFPEKGPALFKKLTEEKNLIDAEIADKTQQLKILENYVEEAVIEEDIAEEVIVAEPVRDEDFKVEIPQKFKEKTAQVKELGKMFDNFEPLKNNMLQTVQATAAELKAKDAVRIGKHKNTDEYTAMISALEAVKNWQPEEDGPSFEEKLAELKTQAEAYIAAKKAQWRPNPSAMRLHRLKYAETLIEFADSSKEDTAAVEAEREKTDSLNSYYIRKGKPEGKENVAMSKFFKVAEGNDDISFDEVSDDNVL